MGSGRSLCRALSRFARELAGVAGDDMLKGLGDRPHAGFGNGFFTEDTPTAVLVRQVLGAIAQFEKASLVAKLKAARDRKRARDGHMPMVPAAASPRFPASQRVYLKR